MFPASSSPDNLFDTCHIYISRAAPWWLVGLIPPALQIRHGVVPNFKLALKPPWHGPHVCRAAPCSWSFDFLFNQQSGSCRMKQSHQEKVASVPWGNCSHYFFSARIHGLVILSLSIIVCSKNIKIIIQFLLASARNDHVIWLRLQLSLQKAQVLSK